MIPNPSLLRSAGWIAVGAGGALLISQSAERVTGAEGHQLYLGAMIGLLGLWLVLLSINREHEEVQANVR